MKPCAWPLLFVLAATQSAQKHTHGRNREVGKSSAQVWLFEHHQHGDADDRCSLHKISQGKFPFAHVGKVLGHCQDEDELHPFGRLEVAKYFADMRERELSW